MLNTDDAPLSNNTDKYQTNLTYSVNQPQVITTASSATVSVLSTLTDTTDTLPGITSPKSRVYYGTELGPRPWEFQTQEECTAHHRQNAHLVLQEGWCNSTFDSYLCWPPTAPHSSVRLQCPPGIKGVDHTKLAERECLAGDWRSSRTDYSPCIIPELRGFINGDDAESKMAVANNSRTLEIFGLSFSLSAILLSILIFCYFRSLRNNRTRMHVNLFVAMMIQIVVRLTVYIDQYVTRHDNYPKTFGIDNTAILCESFYVLLEYARTAMFMWMFIEGLYLHSMLTITVFSSRSNYKCYYVLGWGLPVLMTAVWATVTAIKYTQTQCWWGYNLSPYFWILEGPRLAIILTNFLFLLNILRVLITKMKANASTEKQQVKKAVRAAIVLLPLLGITNVLQMVVSPIESETNLFALWSFASIFLTSFQGFFVALIYCFMNQEVRLTLGKYFINLYHRRRLPMSSRRYSMSTNIQSEAIPMTISIRPCPPVLPVICEASSEKDALQSPETCRPSEPRITSYRLHAPAQSDSCPPGHMLSGVSVMAQISSNSSHAPVHPDVCPPLQILSGDSVMPQIPPDTNILIKDNNCDVRVNKSLVDHNLIANHDDIVDTNHGNIVNIGNMINNDNMDNHGNLYDYNPSNIDVSDSAAYDSSFSSAHSQLLRGAGHANHPLERSSVTGTSEGYPDHSQAGCSLSLLICDDDSNN